MRTRTDTRLSHVHGSVGLVEPAHPLTLLLRGMYREMPGLKLTVPQAARLCSADASECERALERLVHDGELRRGTQGDYLFRG